MQRNFSRLEELDLLVLERLVSEYNQANTVRGNLYKKRSKRFMKAYREVYGDVRTTHDNPALWDRYESKKRALWHAGDERELAIAILECKAASIRLSMWLRPRGLVRLKSSGNRVYAVVCKVTNTVVMCDEHHLPKADSELAYRKLAAARSTLAGRL